MLKLDLHNALRKDVAIDLQPNVAPGVSNTPVSDIREVKFKSKSKQPWTAYLGTNADSVYD